MSRRRRMVVAVSGPDGAGKSSLVQRLAEVLEERGFFVATAYCYGCFVCRRPARGRARRYGPEPGSWSWVSRSHAVVDVTDLLVRLASARLRGRLRAHGRPLGVVTDRGPLDGLAKFDPPPGSRAAVLFTSIGRRYDLVLLLDAPSAVMAARDGEHSRHELDEWRDRYRGWAGHEPSLVRLDTGAQSPAAVAAEAAEAVIAAGESGAFKAARAVRRRVVISSFDSPGNRDYGGGGAEVVEMVAGWLASHFEVTVVTAARHGGAEVRDGVRYRYLPAGWAGPRAGQLLFHAMLPFWARRLPHDLWIESFTPPFSTSFLPLFSRARVVGLAQSLSGESMWRRYRVPFFVVERLGLRFYRDVVVLNDADRALVRRYSPSATIQVIPNCVDLPRLDERLLGHGEHVLFLGRIDVWLKGLDLLLSAYARGALAMPLLVAGAGTSSEERKLAALLAATGGDVRWLGQVTGQRKRDLLERCAFVVLPSRHEAFGLAALEAMAYGKPVVHFDLPSLRWMGGDVRVRPFDLGALAREMRALADDETARRELGRAAHAAAQRYGPEQMSQRYLTLVRQLLGSPGVDVRPGYRAARK